MGGLISESLFSSFKPLCPAITIFRVIITAFGFGNGIQKCLHVLILQILLILACLTCSLASSDTSCYMKDIERSAGRRGRGKTGGVMERLQNSYGTPGKRQ